MRRVLDQFHKREFSQNNFLTGKLLIAMPFIDDNRFDHAVIYMCGHDEQGAIGLVINKPLNSLTFPDLLSQLDIMPSSTARSVQMLTGGPVEVSRGFVLHSLDYQSDSTVRVGEHYSITATLDILRTLAMGNGPNKFILTLGYAGWRANQLEQEIQDNLWMIADPTDEIIFNSPIEFRWRASMLSLGVDPSTLSLDFGRA